MQAEFSFLESIRKQFPPLGKRIVKGIGDDAAALQVGGAEYLLVTTDSLVERVHFDFRWTGWEDLGWKALAVNLSDIAAMGGRPAFVFLTLALPRRISDRNVFQFFKGFKKLADHYSVQLLGGDTVLSRQDVVVHVTALGWVQPHQLKLRSRVRPGDLLCVTGPLGNAAAGLFLLQRRKRGPEALLQALLRPMPRVEMGQFLAGQAGVGGMIDNSDGLVRCAVELARESGVRIRLFTKNFPIVPALSRIAPSPRHAMEWALHGGEDYQLVFSVQKKNLDRVQKKFVRHFGFPFSVVGEVQKGKGVTVMYEDGRKERVKEGGYDAFR